MNTATSFNNKSWPLLFALLATGTLTAQGCGGEDNPEPSNPVVSGGTGGSSSSGRGGGKGKAGASSGGTQSDGGTGDVGNDGGTGDVGATGGSSGKGGSGTGGSSGKGGSSGSGASSGTSTAEGGSGNVGGGEGGSGAEGGEIDCSVRGERNCYRCEPHAEDPAPEWPAALNEQFLNHCDDSLCSPFDNAQRIEGWNGTLPTP